MSTELAGVVLAIILALVAWFLGGHRKSDAETMEKITGAAAEMIEQLRQELQRLTLEVDNVRRENQRFHAEVQNLQVENVSLKAVVRQLEHRLAVFTGEQGP